MNKVKRYVPEKVYKKLQTLNFKNKEHLYVVCDMIYRSSIYKNEDKDYSNQFVDIPRRYFRNIIPNNNSLSLSINLLKDNKIIECDNKYSKEGGKALGYRFNDEYISKLISVDINKNTISSRIIKNRNERNNSVSEELKLYRDYFISTFKIDYESALKHLDNWFNNSINSLGTSYVDGVLDKNWIKLYNQYNHIFISLSSINDGELYFKKNSTNGRIDTNLTSLKSEYKQFILKEDLYQIDIINSQPFILSTYVNRAGTFLNKNEVGEFLEWTGDGTFYENFEKTYFKRTERTLTRKEIKTMMFCIFYSKNGSYPSQKSIFRSIFPTINKLIEKEKEGKHNRFAIKLQKIESEICINVICKELDKKGIQYYTIHDAWLVDKKDIDETKRIISDMFYGHLDRIPKLKTEKL